MHLQLSQGHLTHPPLLGVMFPLWKCQSKSFCCYAHTDSEEIHFYALQTRTAGNPFHQQCDLKTLPFSAGCSTICFPFYLLMVTSLFSVHSCHEGYCGSRQNPESRV